MFVYFVCWTFFAFVCGCIGAYVSNQKNRSELEGFFFGFVLGPIGLVVAGILPTITKPNRATRGGYHGHAKTQRVWPDEIDEAEKKPQAKDEKQHREDEDRAMDYLDDEKRLR